MRIHFIAIGGSIMHSLALMMARLGHTVSGSDDEIYEPSRSRLAEAGLLPDPMGWHPERITGALDIVVLGMHARADNPELQRALELGLKVESFPEFMFNISREKFRIVVAGSHGKTTTSGMIAHAFHYGGMRADRMIGAKIGELEPVELTDAGIVVLEGDEYLSSPLDPRAKFLHYKPHVAIITGIAWDHMNVFPTYADYIAPFRELIQSMDKEALLIYCSDDSDLVDLVDEIRPVCKTISYTTHPYRQTDQRMVISDEDGITYSLDIFGEHNLQNLQAASLATQAAGLDRKKFYTAIQSFKGAHKRLQPLVSSAGFIAYQDFAHAPSKVRATVKAVRQKHPNAHIIACLELHTFSSLNPDFLPQYKDSLADADVKIVHYSPHTLAMKRLPDLSPEKLSQFFNTQDLVVTTTAGDLKQAVLDARFGQETVLLWMSSGRFDGLDIAELSQQIDDEIHSQ